MYFIYMLRCENDYIYTGITNDVQRRFNEHCDIGKGRRGAKYTRAFKPKCIAAVFSVRDRSKAQSVEARIKKLKKENKLLVIDLYTKEHTKKPDLIHVPFYNIKKHLDDMK